MLRQRSFLGVFSLAVLSVLLIQPIQAQEPALDGSARAAKLPSPSHNVLVYYGGEPVLEPLYQSTLAGLSVLQDAVIEETDDAVFFEAQFTTGAFDVMFALTSDDETIRAWRTARTPIPMLVLCTDMEEDEFELLYLLYGECSWEDSPYEPAGDASWSPTAPAEGDGDVVMYEDMIWFGDIFAALGKTFVRICNNVREWVADRLDDFADWLEGLDDKPKIEVLPFIPDGKGGGWIPIRITGKGNVVSIILHKVADIIRPKD